MKLQFYKLVTIFITKQQQQIHFYVLLCKKDEDLTGDSPAKGQ